MTHDSEEEQDGRPTGRQHEKGFRGLQLPEQLSDPRAALLAVVGGGFVLAVSRALRREPSQERGAAAATAKGRGRRGGARPGGSSSEDEDAYSDAHSDEGSEDEAASGSGRASPGILTRMEVDTATWGALLGGHSTHWARLCEAGEKDFGCGGGDARRCCRPPRANLVGSGLLVGGQEVLAVDYLHYDLSTHEDELADLSALLDRLGREVFLRGKARPRLRRFYDPSDESWGFVDCESMLWFNAARYRALLPALGASPSAAAARATSHASASVPSVLNGGAPAPAAPEVDRRFDRRRAEAWFLAACHLLAHHWGAGHGPSFDQRCGRVALRFHPLLAAAFPRHAAPRGDAPGPGFG